MNRSLHLSLISTFAAAAVSAATQTLPFTDQFDYADGNLYTVAAGVWDAAGSSGGEFAVTDATALTAPAGFTTASGKGLKWTPSGTARRNLMQFTSVTSGDVYASFLINVVTAPGGSRLFAYMDNITSSTSNPQLGIFLNGTTLGIGKKASAPTVTTNLSAGTHLVVVRYRFLEENDQVDLWVDPSMTDYGADDVPVSLGSATGASDPANLTYFAINATSGSGPTIHLDELRIGTSWAQVTPAAGGPVIPPVVTNLTVTQTLLTPSGLVLRGTGGTASGTFDVVSATNLSTSLGNWLTLASHQFDGLGNFDCTNPVSPSDTIRFYSLRVGGTNAPPPPVPGAPGFATQPQNLTVAEGQTAVFSVIVTGSPPPDIQWFYSTGTPVAGATLSTLTLTNIQFANAGSYLLTASNASGVVTSTVATLTVTSSNVSNYEMLGFATLNGGTTGGAGGATVTVTSASELEAAMNQKTQLVIQIQGTISFGTLDCKPNKTIIGLGTNATLTGNLKLTHTTNIIVRNITFRDCKDDAITIQEGNRVWVDHCTFIDCGDGELDITHASEWVTVSWCRFFYTNPGNNHRFVNLIGHSDNNAAEDVGHLHITFHNNWWGDLCDQRMPSVRYGRVHLFNNYYNTPGNLYAVRSRLYAECFVENNHFENVRNPWEIYITPAGGPLGKIRALNNNVSYPDTTFGVTWSGTVTNSDKTINLMSAGTDTVFTPPYSYPLPPVSAIPTIVMENAGAGRGPFAP
ncbi:MAG TPA: immunoglobulin domain-containing protein [Verrucomicrobiota bacterium]|nr:immunoglobulin domain-containing protein [Verrucomicrobiota bacterium]